MTQNGSSHYEALGVSSQKEEVHAAFKDFDKGIFPNAFCKILPDIAGDPAYCMALHADGAGTKSSLAYAYWRETGDMQPFRDIPVDAIVMNLDDLLCVGARGPFILSQTIGRNKKLIPAEVLEAIAYGTQDFINQMKKDDIILLPAGGETADVGDLVRTIIIDSSIMVRMKRSDVLEAKIQQGDVIVGLSSFGQSTYEDRYNSGMGSNGLTAARHDVFDHYLAEKYPELFDPAIENLAYTGKHKLDDVIKDTPLNIGQLVLSPTRTYAPIINRVYDFIDGGKIDKDAISAIIHCTGGGQTKCLKFADNVHIIKNGLFPVPDVFQTIYSAGKIKGREMYQNFNMGHRLEIYCKNQSAADLIIQLSNLYNVDAKIIGTCLPFEGKKLTISSKLGTYVYS